MKLFSDARPNPVQSLVPSNSARTNAAPSNRYHLALACWKQKKPEATRLNYRVAIDAGFRSEDMLSIEHQVFGAAVTEMQAAMEVNP